MTFCVNLPIAHAVLLDVKHLNWMRLRWLPFTKAKVRRFDFDEQSLVVVVPQIRVYTHFEHSSGMCTPDQ